MKKIFSFALALMLVVTMLPLSVCASTEKAAAPLPTSYDDSSFTFIPISREEYITEFASSKGISYKDAEKIIDKCISDAVAQIPQPNAWEPDTSIDNGDTTDTVYGRVYGQFKHTSGLKISYSMQAIQITSNYGGTWVSCSSPGKVYPGSGEYTFNGSCTGSIINTTTLRVVLEGVFEVEREIALNLGINLDYLEFGYTGGSKTYYRTEVYKVYNEKSMS